MNIELSDNQKKCSSKIIVHLSNFGSEFKNKYMIIWLWEIFMNYLIFKWKKEVIGLLSLNTKKVVELK